MAFESESWSNTVGKPIALKKVFRQDDLGKFVFTYKSHTPHSSLIVTEFVDMLNALRVGQLNEHHVRKFKELDRDIHCPEGLEPVQLCEHFCLTAPNINSLPLPATPRKTKSAKLMLNGWRNCQGRRDHLSRLTKLAGRNVGTGSQHI